MYIVEVSPVYNTQPSYGQIFVRLPRTYGTRPPPCANDITAALTALCQEIDKIVSSDIQASTAGGFTVSLGGDSDEVQAVADEMRSRFHGKANLSGDAAVVDIMPVHETVAGSVIGKNGSNLRDLKNASGAHIEVSPYTGPTATRQIRIMGTADSVYYARRLVQDAIQAKMMSLSEQVPHEFCGGEYFAPIQPQPWMTMQNQMSWAPNAGASWGAPPRESWGSAQESWGPSQPEHEAIPHQQDYAYSPPQAQITLNDPEPEESRVLAKPGITLKRSVSSRIMRHFHHAEWVLLKDRLALMSEFRKAVRRFFDVQAQEQRAERYGITFGRRTRSWAHFILEEPEQPQEEITVSPVNRPVAPANGMKLVRTESRSALSQPTGCNSMKLVRSSSSSALLRPAVLRPVCA